MAKRAWLRPTITVAFYLALIAFLGIYLVSVDWSVFSTITIAWWYIAVAMVAALVFRYWQTFIWITVLRGLGARDVRMNAELTHVYAKSWLGRYIPGTAPWILGKIYFASQHGVSKSKLAVGSVLEGAIQIATLVLTASITLLLDGRLDVVGAGFKWTMVAVVVLAIIGLLPPVFNALMSLAFRILRRPALSPENRAGWRTIVIAVVQYTVGAAISGAYLYFTAKAFFPDLAWADAFFVIATGNLAGAASMIAVFAPGGVGVREGVQLLLLAIVLPAGIAVVVVIATRVAGIAADLIFFAVTWLTRYRHRARSAQLGQSASDDNPAAPGPLASDS